MYDPETKLYYLKNRYYSHIYHRFINEDSIFDSKNMFCYCLNNPINNIDKNGTNTVKIINYTDTAANMLKCVGVLHYKKPTTKVGYGAYDEEEVVYIYIPNEHLSTFIEYLYFEDIDFTNPYNTSSNTKDALLFVEGVALDMVGAPFVIGCALDILSGLKDRRSAQTETEFRKDLLASRQKSEKTQAGVVIKVTHKNAARMKWHQPTLSHRTMPCHSLEFDTFEFTEFSQSEEGKKLFSMMLTVQIN